MDNQVRRTLPHYEYHLDGCLCKIRGREKYHSNANSLYLNWFCTMPYLFRKVNNKQNLLLLRPWALNEARTRKRKGKQWIVIDEEKKKLVESEKDDEDEDDRVSLKMRMRAMNQLKMIIASIVRFLLGALENSSYTFCCLNIH